MSAPLIWIFFPAVAGLLFWVLRKRAGLVIFLSTALCLLLALLAWLLPIGEPFGLGRLMFTVDPTLAFAGRRLVLDGADRAFLMLIYSLCAFWFAGTSAARANLLSIPFGLGMVALLIAAQAVEPFLYAALLVEMAVLLAVPILAPPGRRLGKGVLRFLIFQTLGMPFILLAGWAMSGVEVDPSNQLLVTLSMVFLCVGFAFWLAVFPFYTWIPLLAEETFPYASGFVLLLLPTIHLLIGLSFIDRFGWLRASLSLHTMIGLVGMLMIATAGIWAAFQKNLTRLFGYGVIVETGFSLLAISLSSQAGQELFASLFLPRVIGLAVWALSLSVLLSQARSAQFDDVVGFSHRLPFATGGLAVASLALGGLPLLAAFPVRQALLEELAGVSLVNALVVLAGSIGMLFSAFRALTVLSRSRPAEVVASPEPAMPEALPAAPVAVNAPAYGESRLQIGLLLMGIVALLLIGIFPQIFLPLLNGLLTGYPQLP